MVIAATSGLLMGFLAGLISFKVKSRWCPQCGATTTAAVPASPNPPRPPRTPNFISTADAIRQPNRAGPST